MAKKARAPRRFDLVEAAEWVSDRTEVDVEIALEIIEADYGYLKGSDAVGGSEETSHRIVASREQVLAVTSKVPVGEETIKAVLDAFMEFLRTRGYVKEVPTPASQD